MLANLLNLGKHLSLGCLHFNVLFLSKKTPQWQDSKWVSDLGEISLMFPRLSVSSARAHLSTEYWILFPVGHAGHQDNNLPVQEP